MIFGMDGPLSRQGFGDGILAPDEREWKGGICLLESESSPLLMGKYPLW